MTIQLICTDPVVTIDLPLDLRLDPPLHSISRIDAVTAVTRGGRLVRWERARKDVSVDIYGGEDFGWTDYATIEALQALTIIEDLSMTLSYHGESMPVYWRHEDTPVLSYTPLIDYSVPDSADKVASVRLKFIWQIS